MTKSRKMPKTRQKFDFRMKPKITTHISSQMLVDNCYAFGLLLNKKFFGEGALIDLL